MEPVHLIIDGDVIAFRAASAVQYPEEDMHGVITYSVELPQAETAVDQIMARLLADIAPGASVTYQVFLSDSTNWRYRIYPDYKANRKDSIRPLALSHLRSYMRTKYGAVHYDDVEADDLVGLALTKPLKIDPEEHPLIHAAGGIKVIAVGRDKDFLSIPGYHYQLTDDDKDGKPIVRHVTLEEADWWHMRQTLSGDSVDNYEGCPTIGPTRAEAALNARQVLEPVKGVITRGPNKGRETVKWVPRPMRDDETLWDVVVSLFAKQGLGELEALTMARLARILRWGEYNFETGEVTLWVPPRANSTSA